MAKSGGVLMVVWLWCLVISVACADRLGSESKQKLEVQKHWNRLNKPPVKSIKSPEGDVIDCVHISHQPAFDHPYLKDLKIQMRPNYHPKGLFDDIKVSAKPKERTNPINQLWHANGKCPEGTITIRRTKQDDVLRPSSVKRYGNKKHRSIPQPRPADPDLINESGHQHSIAYVEGDKYYGAKATINVWEPKIQQPNEFSLSQLWILGGSFGQDLNSIEAGWQVSPDLYGDNNTRLFTYWTSDAYQATGCYNLLCSGFIQINCEIARGASISPVSAFRNSQYQYTYLEGVAHSITSMLKKRASQGGRELTSILQDKGLGPNSAVMLKEKSLDPAILALLQRSSLDVDRDHDVTDVDSNSVDNVFPNQISLSEELRLHGLEKWLQMSRLILHNEAGTPEQACVPFSFVFVLETVSVAIFRPKTIRIINARHKQFEFGFAVLLLSPVVCSIMAFLRSLQAEEMAMTSKPRKVVKWRASVRANIILFLVFVALLLGCVAAVDEQVYFNQTREVASSPNDYEHH